MSDLDIEALRAMTPGCANRNHLNNAGAALLSSVTISAMTGYLQREALIGGYEAEAEAADQIGAVYKSLAELIGALPSQIALFDNSTHAWNAACYSVPLQAGDRILTGATNTAAPCWPICNARTGQGRNSLSSQTTTPARSTSPRSPI